MGYSTKEQLEIINRQIKEMASIYREAVSHSGISENEFWIWYTLVVMEGTYSQREISNMWSISKQTVNTIMTNMVHKGLVTLEVVPGTRNRKTIRMTDAGRAYGEARVLPISLAEQRAFERLPAEDRLACIAAFGKYITALKEEVHDEKNQ